MTRGPETARGFFRCVAGSEAASGYMGFWTAWNSSLIFSPKPSEIR
jgi:hypothetical protein